MVEEENIVFVPIWFDSMGAKSACVYIKTRDVGILIDPGAAELQPSFPMPENLKSYYNVMAHKTISSAGERADIIIITHYHYDHYTHPSSSLIDPDKLYRGKILLVKDPNTYINASQFERARFFIDDLARTYLGTTIEDVLVDSKQEDFEDPSLWIPIATSRDFGDYTDRYRELLAKGRKRFEKLTELWSSNLWVREIDKRELKLFFADNKKFVFGSTKIEFTKPMFHGLEYDRLGWVLGVTIECCGEKVLYSSDVQGPIIEDYAEWIIREEPDIIVLDGPPTYQYGYLMTKTTLSRAINNIERIIRESTAKLIIYDHHIMRDTKWKTRMGDIYREAKKLGKKMVTAAEFLGKKPIAKTAKKHHKKQKI